MQLLHLLYSSFVDKPHNNLICVLESLSPYRPLWVTIRADLLLMTYAGDCQRPMPHP